MQKRIKDLSRCSQKSPGHIQGSLPGCKVWAPPDNHRQAPLTPLISDLKRRYLSFFLSFFFKEASFWEASGSPIRLPPQALQCRFQNIISGNSNSRGLRQGPRIYIFPKIPWWSCQLSMSGNHWTRHCRGQRVTRPACTSAPQGSQGTGAVDGTAVRCKRETPCMSSNERRRLGRQLGNPYEKACFGRFSQAQ